jgi:hypothetical protein
MASGRSTTRRLQSRAHVLAQQVESRHRSDDDTDDCRYEDREGERHRVDANGAQTGKFRWTERNERPNAHARHDQSQRSTDHG